MPSLVNERPEAASADSTRDSSRCATPNKVRTSGSKPTSSRPQVSFTCELYGSEPSSVNPCQALTEGLILCRAAQKSKRKGATFPLKIALKYGLLTTACFIVWVVIAHWLVPDPRSTVHSAGAGVFVNIVEIIAIALGIRERKNAYAGQLSFKDGLKTGVAI